MPYEVSQLLRNLGAPVSASPEEPVRIAVDRMLGNGFSQLPVVKGTGPQAQFYLITHESILMALHNFGSRIETSGLRVQDALVRVQRVYRSTDDLFELLIGVRDSNAALIVDDDGKLTHIVTSYDTAVYFRDWAENIMQVRDIEHSLRRIIGAGFRRREGVIDEDMRRTAVEEITSSNKALRKKFVRAMKQCLGQYAPVGAEIDGKKLDTAFAAFINGAGGLASQSVEGDGTGQDGVVALVSATDALSARFADGVRAYVGEFTGTDIEPNEALLDDAFKILYDKNEQIKEFGALTLSEYVVLFFKDACWGRCKDAIGLREEEVKHMLEGVRETRNSLAHFREEEITAQKRIQLQRCAAWLNEREKAILEAFEKNPLVPKPGDSLSDSYGESNA